MDVHHPRSPAAACDSFLELLAPGLCMSGGRFAAWRCTFPLRVSPSRPWSSNRAGLATVLRVWEDMSRLLESWGEAGRNPVPPEWLKGRVPSLFNSWPKGWTRASKSRCDMLQTEPQPSFLALNLGHLQLRLHQKSGDYNNPFWLENLWT